MFDLPTTDTFILFIVDTNTYAGSFERSMVAFMTGLVGECGVGIEDAKIARRELGELTCEMFDEEVVQRSDGSGCRRPASIWASPDKQMNSVVIVLATLPSPATIALLKARARRYCEAPPTKLVEPLCLLGFRIVEYKVTVEQTEIAVN